MPFYTTDENGQVVYVNEDGTVTATPEVRGQVGPDVISGAAPQTPAPAPAPAPATNLVDAGSTYSQSYSGYDPRKVEASGTRMGQAYGAAEAQGQAQYEALSQPIIQAAQGRQDSIISAQEAQGAPSIYAATDAQLQAKARAEAQQAKMYADFAVEEDRANQLAMAKVQQARAEYTSQVQAYQAMQVNPGQLWGNSDGMGRFQMLASVFAHDFLGAKGIKTSAMDTINRAIDQNINAQVANINKQGQVAEHFKELYGMVVRESATQSEARQRMRGFYLAQMEKEITAELLKYDSPLARAKAVEARMMVQEQLAKDLGNLDQIVDGRVQQAKNRAVDVRRMEIQAAQESQRIALGRDQLALERDKHEASKGPKPFDVTKVYYNPETGLPEGEIVAGSDSVVDEVRTSAAAAADFAAKAGELKDLMNAKHHGVYAGPWADKYRGLTQDQLSHRIEALQMDLVHTWAKAKDPGGRLAKDDVENAMKVILIENLTGSNTDEVISQAIKLTMDAANSNSKGKVRELPPEIKAQLGRGIETNVGRGRYEEAVNDLDPSSKPVSTPSEDSFEKADRPNVDHVKWTEIAVDDAILEAKNLPKAEAAKVLEKTLLNLETFNTRPIEEAEKFDVEDDIQRVTEEYIKITGANPPRSTETGRKIERRSVLPLLSRRPDSLTDEEKVALHSYARNNPGDKKVIAYFEKYDFANGQLVNPEPVKKQGWDKK
jgi:hypothetical protein